MQRVAGLVVVGTGLILLGGCKGTMAPVYNVDSAPVKYELEESQVRQAILAAGEALGWTFVVLAPGIIEGNLDLKRHGATISLLYDATQVSIQYKDSTQLAYADGQINRRYNAWIDNLHRRIQLNLDLARR